jgi:ceramide glucosyltransferase
MNVRTLASGATGALALASLTYGAFALERTLAFGRRSRARTEPSPRISIIKPLHGTSDSLEANLRSFCDQNYPNFEVILGARSADDAAMTVAWQVAADFPAHVRVYHADDATPTHTNPKANTLAALLPHATGDILAISDADMRTDRAYLGAIATAFVDPEVGAVTCLYRGEPADAGLASALGALANHEHFAPSVLIARTLGPMTFTFGATMAVRAGLFAAAGGLDAIGSRLADDAALGEIVTGQGARVALASCVVGNRVQEPTLAALWAHELRWARTHRALRPGGYIGLAVTYAIPLAALHLAVARSRGALGIFAAALGLRYALSAAARRAFDVPAATAPWLIPLRDTFGLAVWAAAFAGRDVRWDGATLLPRKDGTLA